MGRVHPLLSTTCWVELWLKTSTVPRHHMLSSKQQTEKYVCACPFWQVPSTSQFCSRFLLQWLLQRRLRSNAIRPLWNGSWATGFSLLGNPNTQTWGGPCDPTPKMGSGRKLPVTFRREGFIVSFSTPVLGPRNMTNCALLPHRPSSPWASHVDLQCRH